MGAVSKGANALLDLLDMSHDARMARAREMGFDTDRVWYHGRSNKGQDFDQKTERRPFLTTSRERAEGYGSGEPEAFYLRMESPARANEYSDMFHDAAYSQDGRQWLAEDGHDAVLDAGNPWDDGPRPSGDVAAPFDVAQIRSVNAAFDPAKKDSSNLLASVGGAGVLGAAALSPEDATAAELVQATGPGPDLALLRAAYGEGGQQPNLLTSLFNSGAEMAAAVNRGVTSGVDFLTVDQANALLQLLGAERQLPTLTETLAPATTGNFLNPGAHRDATRALGELLSPI